MAKFDGKSTVKNIWGETIKEVPIKVGKFADNVSDEMVKVLKRNSSDLATDMVKLTEKYGSKGLIGVSAIVAGASVMDMMMGAQDKKRAQRNNAKQEKKFRQKQESSLNDRYMGIVDPQKYDGLVQDMFDGRIGHSNTWGGQRY